MHKPNETRFRDLNEQLSNILRIEKVFREIKAKDSDEQKPIAGVQNLDFSFVRALQGVTARLIQLIDKFETDLPTSGHAIKWQIQCMIRTLDVSQKSDFAF